jgi:hypothetical protein
MPYWLKSLTKVFAIITAVFFSLALAPADETPWQDYKSTHFIIYYKNAKDNFVCHVADEAERYYDRIADGLGFRRYNFWLWSDRAKIYLYDDAQSYHAATKEPEWSSGFASLKAKTICTFCEAGSFLDTVLPHEMGHIIFREFVGFDNYCIPHWLDEGVASFQENIKWRTADAVVKQAKKENKFIGFKDLSKLDPHSIKDTVSVEIFYAESLSIVNFLVQRFGKDQFSEFCQALNKFNDLDKALAHAYDFRNAQELDEAWERYLRL